MNLLLIYEICCGVAINLSLFPLLKKCREMEIHGETPYV